MASLAGAGAGAGACCYSSVLRHEFVRTENLWNLQATVRRSSRSLGSRLRAVCGNAVSSTGRVCESNCRDLSSGIDGSLYLSRLRAEAEGFVRKAAAVAVSTLLTVQMCAEPASARLEGVNKPELLPSEFTEVIDVAGFLTEGQEKRLAEDIRRLEADTGFKLRILAQNYPQTPGLAIKDFWGVDDQTIVFVADPSLGNILNFNIGAMVDLSVPRSFWSRLAGKYGNIFYWRDNGEEAAIEAAVVAIDACLREPIGPRQCAEIC
eukprot:TRINITY_DN6032_c0_g3_i1.p1 TRINITY_DN6032_c0_g3~~TRINITY_DN6032_c0_g3_i1.p1  ORF type:complete len:264 (+),score=38.07 TRINITY_DN6032_c0_g3_i1:64-855(+)